MTATTQTATTQTSLPPSSVASPSSESDLDDNDHSANDASGLRHRHENKQNGSTDVTKSTAVSPPIRILSVGRGSVPAAPLPPSPGFKEFVGVGGGAASLPYGMGSPSTKAVNGATRMAHNGTDVLSASSLGSTSVISAKTATPVGGGLPPLHPPPIKQHSHLRPSPSGRRKPFLMSNHACLAEGWDVIDGEETSLSPAARASLSGESDDLHLQYIYW